MSLSKGKTILLVLPKSQFREEELCDVHLLLSRAGMSLVVLSKTGQEMRGMGKTKFQPDGILADWDKQPGVHGKYDAVLVLGGKGSAKSLWEDPILPQILTDHYRAGKLVGAVAESVVVLAKAGLIHGSASAPQDKKTRQTLEALSIAPLDEPLSFSNHVLVAKDMITSYNSRICTKEEVY